ncbi:MAG: STAS domain-containing protein [Planctomycetota bacterium]
MTDLTLDVKRLSSVGDGALVTIAGAIDASTVMQFQSAIENLQLKGFRRFVIDMDGIRYVNSTGMGALVRLVDQLEATGGRFVLLRIHPRVRIVIEALGMNVYFQIFDEQAQAEAAIGQQEASAPAPRPAAPTPSPSATAKLRTTTCEVCGATVRIQLPGTFPCSQCRTMFTIAPDASVTFHKGVTAGAKGGPSKLAEATASATDAIPLDEVQEAVSAAKTAAEEVQRSVRSTGTAMPRQDVAPAEKAKKSMAAPGAGAGAGASAGAAAAAVPVRSTGTAMPRSEIAMAAPAPAARPASPAPATRAVAMPTTTTATTTTGEAADDDMAGAGSARKRDGKPAKILARRTTVRFWKRMNPHNNYPLLVLLTKDKVEQQKQAGVGQVEGGGVQVTAEDPMIEIVPRIPGCLVVPYRMVVDARPAEVEARFSVTPLGKGSLPDACVDLFHSGRRVDSVALPIKVSSTFWARLFALLCAALPAVLGFAEAFGLKLEIQSAAGKLAQQAVAQLNESTAMFGLAGGGVCLLLTLIFWFIARARQGDPVQRFVTWDSARIGT